MAENFKKMAVENVQIDTDYILKVVNNREYNSVILDYYSKFEKENKDLISKNRIESMKKCNKFWTIGRYDYNQVKDFIKTNLCHDKFCNNCKKVKQACRMSRYIPELDKYKDSMYHMILTIPNCNSNELDKKIKLMAVSFKKLILYLSGKKRIKEIDFIKYKYLGAIRSLEITFNEDSYHPHYHVAIAFSNLELEKNILNNYSYDYMNKKSIRYFSEFEILIQKIWYLLINEMVVNKKNINKLDLGYSCAVNKFNNNDYAELFKYMTKETDEKSNILTYDNFKTLYLSTYRIKQIQGYGCFYMINDERIDEEVDKVYLDLKEILEKEEKPKIEDVNPYDLLYDNDYLLISRKKIYQYLRNNK